MTGHCPPDICPSIGFTAIELLFTATVWVNKVRVSIIRVMLAVTIKG